MRGPLRGGDALVDGDLVIALEMGEIERECLVLTKKIKFATRLIVELLFERVREDVQRLADSFEARLGSGARLGRRIHGQPVRVALHRAFFVRDCEAETHIRFVSTPEGRKRTKNGEHRAHF